MSLKIKNAVDYSIGLCLNGINNSKNSHSDLLTTKKTNNKNVR